MILAPTGRHYSLSHADQIASIAQVGASLRAYAVGGRDVVHPTPEDAVPAGAAGAVLAPWPNRVRDGRWEWRGEARQLALTEPTMGNAIHGLVRWAPFQEVSYDGRQVELEAFVPAQSGWPGPVVVRAAYALGDGGLTATVTGTNVGAQPLPFGIGAHPYLACPGGVDSARLTLRASTYLEVDDRGLPVAEHPAGGSPYDVGSGQEIGDRVIDTTYTGLDRSADGRVEAVLEAADGRCAVLWGDESVTWMQVFTADTLPPEWNRKAVAVEPLTCPVDALNSGRDLRELAPGESMTMSWGLRLE